jgi:hypothetical protein
LSQHGATFGPRADDLELPRSRRVVELASMVNSDAENHKQVASDDHLFNQPEPGPSSLS